MSVAPGRQGQRAACPVGGAPTTDTQLHASHLALSGYGTWCCPRHTDVVPCTVLAHPSRAPSLPPALPLPSPTTTTTPSQPLTSPPHPLTVPLVLTCIFMRLFLLSGNAETSLRPPFPQAPPTRATSSCTRCSTPPPGCPATAPTSPPPTCGHCWSDTACRCSPWRAGGEAGGGREARGGMGAGEGGAEGRRLQEEAGEGVTFMFS